MNTEFENILDDCLERLLVRNETIEDCLNAYPQQSDALRPLLQTTLLTKNATTFEPRPEFKASARYQFRIAIQEAASAKNSFLSEFRFRLASALTAIIVMLMAGSGLVVAAGTSMPDNPLYSVKLAVEQMQINLTFSDLDKARLISGFTSRRVSEIIHMAQKGDNNRIITGTVLLNNQLGIIVNLVDNSGSLLQDDIVFMEDGQPSLGTDKSPPAPLITLPPSLITDEVFQNPLTEDGEASNLLTILLQDFIENSDALRESLPTIPQSSQIPLLETIEVVDGYYNAITATGE
jgi:hypothetical protein